MGYLLSLENRFSLGPKKSALFDAALKRGNAEPTPGPVRDPRSLSRCQAGSWPAPQREPETARTAVEAHRCPFWVSVLKKQMALVQGGFIAEPGFLPCKIELACTVSPISPGSIKWKGHGIYFLFLLVFLPLKWKYLEQHRNPQTKSVVINSQCTGPGRA